MMEALLLVIVIGATLLIMFTFIRGGIAGRAKVGADAFGHGLLYK